MLTKKEEKIMKDFMDMMQKKGWKPMKSEDGCAWFGGKTHSTLTDYLPKEALKHHYEDLDFLVIGWSA